VKDTLCIIASHPLAQRFDFDRTDCDIWGFNEVLKQDWYKRADAIFQMHLEAIWRNPQNRNDPKHFEWLASGNTPLIYMLDAHKDVPMSKKYPLDEIVADLLPTFKWEAASGYTDNKYFSSSISYAVALGIFKGYKKIECWGMEMNTDTEYRYQRDGLTFWQGIAVGRGVELIAYTDIYNAPLYGYEGEASLKYDTFKKRIDFLNLDVPKAKAGYDAAKDKADQAAVAFLATFKEPETVVDTLKAQVLAAFEYGILDGATQENERYKQKADAMKEATEGAFQFSRQEFEAGTYNNRKAKDKAEMKAHALAGVCNELFNRARAMKAHGRRKTIMRKFAATAGQYIEASAYVGLFTGCYQENANYLQVLDKLIRAAGGTKSEAVLLGENNA